MMARSDNHLPIPDSASGTPLLHHKLETVASHGFEKFAYHTSSDSGGGSPLRYPVPINDHESIVHVRIVDKNKKIHNGWKKVPSEGPVPRGQRYIDADLWLVMNKIVDDHGGKHFIWERNGLFTDSELQSPKYKQYRKRDRKEIDKKGEVIWPNFVEDAFQIAIREIRPMGKKKVRKRSSTDSARSESFGRNELIGIRIQQLTGKVRKRKQISSHIQVLKKLMDPDRLKYVTNATNSDAARGPLCRYLDPDTYQLVMGQSDNYVDGFNWDVSGEKRKFLAKLPLPSTMLEYPHQPQKPLIQRIQLEMNLHVPISSAYNPKYEICHNYTRIQSETGARSRELGEVRGCISKFVEFNPDEIDQMSCEFILLDAEFDITDQPPAKNSLLGVDFNLFISSSSRYTNWKYETRFYEEGISKKQRSANLQNSSTNPNQVHLNVPLESSWWVDVFGKISARRCEKLAAGNQQQVQQEEKHARRYLKELTVTQQISAIDASTHKTQRLAVLLWSFDLTCHGEVAVTTWRRINRLSPLPETKPLLNQYSHENPPNSLPSNANPWENWEQQFCPMPDYQRSPGRVNSSTMRNPSTASLTPPVDELVVAEHDIDYGTLVRQSYPSFPDQLPAQFFENQTEHSYELQLASVSHYTDSQLPIPCGLDGYPHQRNEHEQLNTHNGVKNEFEPLHQPSDNYFSHDDTEHEDSNNVYQRHSTAHHDIDGFVGGNIHLNFNTESTSADLYNSSSMPSVAEIHAPYYHQSQTSNSYQYQNNGHLSSIIEGAETPYSQRLPQQFQKLHIESPQPLRPSAEFLGDTRYFQSTILDGFGDMSRDGKFREHNGSPAQHGQVLGEVGVEVDLDDFGRGQIGCDVAVPSNC